jgi:hypothetical protein
MLRLILYFLIMKGHEFSYFSVMQIVAKSKSVCSVVTQRVQDISATSSLLFLVKQFASVSNIMGQRTVLGPHTRCT